MNIMTMTNNKKLYYMILKIVPGLQFTPLLMKPFTWYRRQFNEPKFMRSLLLYKIRNTTQARAKLSVGCSNTSTNAGALAHDFWRQVWKRNTGKIYKKRGT